MMIPRRVPSIFLILLLRITMAFQPSSIFPKSNSNHIRSSFQQFNGPASMQRLQSFHGPLPKHQPSLSKLLLSVDESTVASSSSQFFQNTDVWVFLAGVFPFAWATVEFWRRIMFGEPFGTGRDSVIIGMDDAPQDSRGRRVLGKGALITAYVLFVIAFGTIGVVLYSVLSSAPPPTEFV